MRWICDQVAACGILLSQSFTLREYRFAWQRKVKTRLAKANHLVHAWKHLAPIWKPVALLYEVTLQNGCKS